MGFLKTLELFDPKQHQILVKDNECCIYFIDLEKHVTFKYESNVMLIDIANLAELKIDLNNSDVNVQRADSEQFIIKSVPDCNSIMIFVKQYDESISIHYSINNSVFKIDLYTEKNNDNSHVSISKVELNLNIESKE